jgi:hypothetical protein
MGMAVALTATVCALGIGAATASASIFESSGGASKGKSYTITGQEVFDVYPMVVDCTKTTSKSVAPLPAGTFNEFEIEVKYTTCTTFGSIKVTVEPGFFKYSAEWGGVEEVTKPIAIKFSVLGCEDVVGVQQVSTAGSVMFGDVEFYNPMLNKKIFPNSIQKKLEIADSFQGLHYTAKKWPCVGPVNAEELKEAKEESSPETEGAYVGGVEETITNGNLTWHAL